MYTNDEKYNVHVSGMVNQYGGTVKDKNEMSVVDQFALAALPAVIQLFGQNQPYAIAEEAYRIAYSMAAQRKLND